MSHARLNELFKFKCYLLIMWLHYLFHPIQVTVTLKQSEAFMNRVDASDGAAEYVSQPIIKTVQVRLYGSDKVMMKWSKRSATSQNVTTGLSVADKAIGQRQRRNTNNLRGPQKNHLIGAVSKKITGVIKLV